MSLWVVSDTHFGHANILTFTWTPPGATEPVRIRPEFTSVEEMDEAMVERWNAVVKRGDVVYHLGDFALKLRTQQAVRLARRLNGRKRLVRGNHDGYSMAAYAEMGFEHVHGVRLIEQVWLSHFPIHPACMGKALGNAHGHIHQNPSPPGLYFNASVECVAYQPVEISEIRRALVLGVIEGGGDVHARAAR